MHMMVKFENVSRGIPIHHGRADDPDGGGVYTNPNLTGVTIHGVAPGSIGEMPDGPGARHFEGQKLIRVLSRDATPNRDAREEKIVSLEETNARLVSDVARLSAQVASMSGYAPQSVMAPVEAKKQSAKPA